MTLYDLYDLPCNKIELYVYIIWNTGVHLRVYPHFRVIQSVVEAVTTSEETSGAAAQKVAEAVMKASEPLGPWHDLTASPNLGNSVWGFGKLDFPQASSWGNLYRLVKYFWFGNSSYGKSLGKCCGGGFVGKKRREPIVNKQGFACPSFPQPRKNGMNHVISMFFAVAFFFVP